MSMSKKDFIALADRIKSHNHLAPKCGETVFTADQIEALANFCRNQNSNFMRDRWLGYIAGTNGKNGGEVKPIRLLECGCCGQFHPEGNLLPGGSSNPMNDCRYDANRFTGSEDFRARTGKEAIEVFLDER